MAADRPDYEFYDFYSVSPEYFGFTLVIDYCVGGKKIIEMKKVRKNLLRSGLHPHILNLDTMWK
jgi:hypothetical protein